MQVVVREAVPDDARRIAEVHIRTWQVAYRGIVPDEYLDALSVDRREELWRGLLGTAGDEINWVAIRDGEVLGFSGCGPSRDDDARERTGEVFAIYVLPEAWGTDVGRSLMDVTLEHLRANFDRATLWVLEDNDRARRFYERAGWTWDGTTKDDAARGFVLREVRYRIGL